MNSSNAEENLRVIRSLMERATIYRTISFPAAAFAGVLALGVGAYTIFFKPAIAFCSEWLIVLALCMAVNFFFLWKESRRRGERFLSSGMRLAIRCVAPILFLGAMVTVWFRFADGDPVSMVMIWILSYGLLLLTTQTFAPKSLVCFGWIFLITGVAVPPLTILLFMKMEIYHANDPITVASLLMAATFGVYHLAYACVGLLNNPKSKAS